MSSKSLHSMKEKNLGVLNKKRSSGNFKEITVVLEYGPYIFILIMIIYKGIESSTKLEKHY